MSRRFLPPHGCIFAAVILVIISAPALSATESAPTTLDAVVVTAAGFEQKLIDAPASISIVTREQIKQRPYASLTDILRDIEGVDVDMEGSNDKNAMGYVSMRGMPADYTLVLVDGRGRWPPPEQYRRHLSQLLRQRPVRVHPAGGCD